MLFGREKELHMLSEMYASKHFRFLVLYGRHRVGKTALLSEFAGKKDALYFCAQEKNDSLNLADFSDCLRRHFEKGSSGSFSDWETAFSYLNSRIGEKRLLIIIEDFHILADAHPQIIRLLKSAIDRTWRLKNIFLIISDSDAAFMENIMLGYSSPFYGLVTGQMILSPLDYLDSSRFYPGYSAGEKLMVYGILGGIPCYTGQFEEALPLAGNIARHILSDGAFLKGEPLNLLHAGFREPGVYNSILEAISCGAHRMNDISLIIHEETQKCSKYLNTLRSAWLVDKITPVGEDEASKKSLYMLSGNFYRFWYRFVYRSRSFLDHRKPEEIAEGILASPEFSAYMEEIFEDVCREYLIRKAVAGKLPVSPDVVGKWWSGSSKTRKCHAIDAVAIDKSKTMAVFGSCKYSDAPYSEAEFNEFLAAVRSFGKVSEAYYYIFSKSGFSEEVPARAKKVKNVKFLTLEDLYKG